MLHSSLLPQKVRFIRDVYQDFILYTSLNTMLQVKKSYPLFCTSPEHFIPPKVLRLGVEIRESMA
jgi:hypothetical protein